MSEPAVVSQVNVEKGACCCMENMDELFTDNLLNRSEESLKTQRLISFIGQQSSEQRCYKPLQAPYKANSSH